MTQDTSDGQSHAARVLELAETDPQLQELMPDPAVQAALRQPGLSYSADHRHRAGRLCQASGAGRAGVRGRARSRARAGASGSTCLASTRSRTTSSHNRIKGLANTWRHHEQHRVEPGDFVCILGFSGTDYATVDLACVYAQAVSVPLQTTLATADLDGIFTDTAPTAVAATVDDLVQAAEFAGRARVDPQRHRARLRRARRRRPRAVRRGPDGAGPDQVEGAS